MRILITGSGGQLGRAFQEGAKDRQLIPLDSTALDIVSLGVVRQAIDAHRPTIVINCGAYTSVDQAELAPEQAWRVNAVGPRNLAIATAERGIPLVHVSTDYVFDGRAERPYHEYDLTGPLSVYGRTKLAGEQGVIAHNPRHYIVRTAWLYHYHAGPAGNFPLTMLRLAVHGQVRVVSDQYGSPTYAPHLVEAIHSLLDTDAFGVYHFAGRGGTSWYELTRRLYDHLGLNVTVTPVATTEFIRPAPRPRYSILKTIQSPEIVLPEWEEGLASFASRIKNGS
ncbi:MAG: dTDP-4-dehydrorhamnose reductase [Acidobacteria bacterium]|nr:dTDP-4-dehydrorhamnose reductase [Acidobacteriota bacterium]